MAPQPELGAFSPTGPPDHFGEDLSWPPLPRQRLVHHVIPGVGSVATPEDPHEPIVVDEQARGLRLVDQPLEGGPPEAAIGRRVTATDVRVNTGEPQLATVLAGGRLEEVLAEEAPPLVERDGVADDRYTGVAPRVR